MRRRFRITFCGSHVRKRRKDEKKLFQRSLDFATKAEWSWTRSTKPPFPIPLLRRRICFESSGRSDIFLYAQQTEKGCIYVTKKFGWLHVFFRTFFNLFFYSASDQKSIKSIKLLTHNYYSSAPPGGNISQNFSEIIFDFLIFQFSEKFWEIFQISSESSRSSPKITEWEI